MGKQMPLSGGKLIARVVCETSGTYRAEFVGSKARQRLPASACHPSRDEAERWVQTEAAALGVDVEWTSPRSEGTLRSL